MTAEIRFHRITTVLLTAALLATLTVALTGGQRAEAVDGPVDLVYVATGRNFPDALAGANLAATVGAPMLTVEPDLPIPDATVTALQALDPNQIIILGGPGAVSEGVQDALAALTRSGSVTRIEGLDRHATAAAIADALPDKVHDADRLDGLDSSAFLRSNAPLDADTIDGIDGLEVLTDARRISAYSGNTSMQTLPAPPAWKTLAAAVVSFPDDCDPDGDAPIAAYRVHIEAQVQVHNDGGAAETTVGIRLGSSGNPPTGLTRIVKTGSADKIPVSIATTLTFHEGTTQTIEVVGQTSSDFNSAQAPHLGITTVAFSCGLGI